MIASILIQSFVFAYFKEHVFKTWNHSSLCLIYLQTLLTMQDILLKVFVVALGLLTYPMDDPRVEEEWDGEDTQKYEFRLLKEEEKWDQEMAPVSEEIAHFDDKGPLDGIRNIQKEQHESGQHVTEKDKMTVLDNVTITKQDSEEDSANHKLPEEVDAEQKEKLQLDMKSKQGEDIQTSFRDSNTPQGQDEKPEREQQEAPSLSEVHTKTSKNKISKKAIAEWGKDFLYYIWNTFSIISMICFLRKYLRNNSQMTQDKARGFPLTCIAGEVLLPDSDTLLNFHTKCVQVSSKTKWREDEFLEGFANDLLETMRTICNRNGGMVIEDFNMVDVSDINVPFTPPEPYSFQFLLWNNQASDLLPDMQVCGKIRVVENKKIQNGCHCQSSDADDDMVCLLHCENDKVQTRITNVCDDLCLKNTPFLSKSRVTRWFQSIIKQAWALISHKYEFELNVRYIDAPGTLAIRFRSGKMIRFRMNPVVKCNTDAYFYITPCSPRDLDTFWTLSLTSYEDSLLQCLSKRLPDNACHIQTLEIAYFLHRRQTKLLGSCAVKDFHFKTALMHLLLTKDSSQWNPNYLAHRLQDLMDFMERSLEKKLLHHILIGNPVTQKFIQLPAEFTQAKPVNLFHPLVVHNCIYRNAAMHFQEMLKNTHMLIQDYVDQCSDSVACAV